MFTIPSWIKSIAKNVSAEGNIRPALACVHITKDGRLQATNSFIAVSFRADFGDNKNKTAEKYPEIGARKLEEVPEGGISLPTDLIHSIPMIRSKFAEILDKRFVLCDPHPDRGTQFFADHVAVGVTDLNRTQVITGRKIAAKFPEIEPLIDDALTSPPVEKVRVDVDYMIAILKTYKDAGFRDVVMEPRATALVFSAREDAKAARAILMPLKW